MVKLCEPDTKAVRVESKAVVGTRKQALEGDKMHPTERTEGTEGYGKMGRSLRRRQP